MTFLDALSALADLSAPFACPSPVGLDDGELLAVQRSLAEIRRRVDAASAVVAGEIGLRSRPELGHGGLAQRLGARTPEILIQQQTGVSKQDARTLARVGALLAEPEPWLDPVAGAVGDGTSSVAAAEVIRAGLGEPDARVGADELGAAAAQLLREATALTLERLAARARQLRGELDLDGVADREALLRSRRYLHLTPQADGMTRLSGLLDPESAATVVATLDAATSPRRGGPRFVDERDIARAERLIADERTTEQIALDTFVDLVRLGTLADDGTLLGCSTPTVRILVTKRELDADRGTGHLEGQRDPVSIATVRRRACADGAIPILFDGKQPIDLGRTERLFTSRQKTAIAARDGGCIFPGCERPPSWTETHHIDDWQHGGRTDVRDGVLLCRHHHLLLHNNGWLCRRVDDAYEFVPPASLDPARTAIPAQQRSLAARKVAG
ncbi:MAG: hypothetical protein BGO97_12230 [Micrococcales bacterium 70-64]|nr:DUF222 domain-containing protein [Leifsonia sp.]ODU64726.1 MAG: hypothetical protein ABT06_12230 [Leifsonia sp. SCN 70-46]OJX86417.1 MAG: hypothetical protein BGO97_12230 [Micrococcales bacterium 70-64]